jgi:hypothetical protein
MHLQARALCLQQHNCLSVYLGGRKTGAVMHRFAVDRTPLQRMLVATVLHAQLGPDGGFIPARSEASHAFEPEPRALRASDCLGPTGRMSPIGSRSRVNPGEIDAYAEFHTLGKLPDELFDTPKVEPNSSSGERPWHERCHAGPVTEEDAAAVKAFVKSFETVRMLSARVLLEDSFLRNVNRITTLCGQPVFAGTYLNTWRGKKSVIHCVLQMGSVPLNDEQKHAAATMCECSRGRKPLALFGPPGTGKTVTLVEMVLQACFRIFQIFWFRHVQALVTRLLN